MNQHDILISSFKKKQGRRLRGLLRLSVVEMLMCFMDITFEVCEDYTGCNLNEGFSWSSVTETRGSKKSRGMMFIKRRYTVK
jgi:hypothetical protein